MKKKTIIFAVLLVTVSLNTFAQRMIIGKVVDANEESGMPGVNIIVKGTPLGTTTDIDGNFALRVPNDATIVISFTGYKTIEMPIENETDFDITLEPDVQILGDVVVTADKNQNEKVTTAFGIERDPQSLPYVVYQMSGDEFRRFGGYSFASTLASNIPVLSVAKMNQGAGAIELLSSRLNVIICLYVIDGIPFNIRREIDLGSGRKVIEYDDSLISMINPENIESVTVLPSANAAMLYGSAGAAGAIKKDNDYLPPTNPKPIYKILAI